MRTEELATRIVAVMSDGYDDKEQEAQGIEQIKQALEDTLAPHDYVFDIIEHLTTLLEDSGN